MREYTKKRKAALKETDVVAEDLRDGHVLVKNAEYLRLPHTNKNLLWSVRQRMIFRYEKHKDDASLLLLEAEAEGLSDDGDGSDKEGRPASEDSGDEDPAVAARRLREENRWSLVRATPGSTRRWNSA